MMAIIVAGLGSAPIRRLHTTWELVPKPAMELFKQMDSILEERVSHTDAESHRDIRPVNKSTMHIKDR